MRTNALVHSIEPIADATRGGGVRVRYALRPTGSDSDGDGGLHGDGGSATRGVVWRSLRARRVIYAAPLFTAQHVIRDQTWAAASKSWLPSFTYAPWLVANLHLTRAPDGHARCDNVVYGAAGLGYTLSTPAASGLRAWLGASTGAVLTYYRALSHLPPEHARREAMQTPWEEYVAPAPHTHICFLHHAPPTYLPLAEHALSAQAVPHPVLSPAMPVRASRLTSSSAP